MINDKNYEGLYSMISAKSKQNISEEDFLSRNELPYRTFGNVTVVGIVILLSQQLPVLHK